MAPKFKFSEGEKVLCFHGPLLYEAKCMKVQAKDKGIKYYIHYSGWNKNWDEWVPESRVLKYNESNLMHQKELEASHGKKSKAVKGGTKRELSDRETSVLPPQEKTTKQKNKEVASEVESETPVETQRKKKCRTDLHVETEEEFTQKLEIKIRIPDELKHWLVDDWKAITLQKKVFKLPSRVPVETILEDYLKYKLSVKGITLNKETAVTETVCGIREYFNVMFSRRLLYKFERALHNEFMLQNPTATPSQIYGAFHLLRVFTKVGGSLAYTQLDEETIQILNNNMFDFLKYMSKRSATYFNLSDYEESSSTEFKKENNQ